MSQKHYKNTRFLSKTDADLNLYHLAPNNAPRALVVIAHGLAEHAKRYQRFSNFLADNDIASFTYDQRGHGTTTAPDAPFGTFAKKDARQTILNDLDAVIAHAKSTHPNIPVVLFGHSMGGLIAFNYVLETKQELAGVAVWNSNFKYGFLGRLAVTILKIERFFRGSDVPSPMLKKLTFDDWAKKIKPAKTNFDWLSHDHSEVQKYIDDPLCGFDVNVSMWLTVLEMVSFGGVVSNLKKINPNLAIQLVGGEQDPATENGSAVNWLAGRIKKSCKNHIQHTVFPECRHETLNESEALRDAAHIHFLKWLDEDTKNFI